MDIFRQNVKPVRSKKYPLILLAAWTAVVAFSLAVTLNEQHKNTLKNAAVEARTHLALNLGYRAMIAKLGGVYASVDKVSPNPYLVTPKKDISTTDGDKLTLLNPAYMTRLTFEDIRKKSTLPVISKITSLKILNPINVPDEWERKALVAFEKGQKETSEVTAIKGEPYLRLMRPFTTEKSCLKCHGHQGYKKGDIRGGISIAVPLKPYFGYEAGIRKTSIVTHALFWLSGCAGLLFFSRFRRKQEQRIAENEWKFRIVSESATDWEYWLSENREIVHMSPSSRKITGYGPEEFLSNPDLLTNIVYSEDRDLYLRHLDDFRGEHEDMEIRIITKAGQPRWIAHSCSPLHIKDKFLGRRISNKDITDRKRTEESLLKLSHAVEHSPVSIVITDAAGNIEFTNPKFTEMTGYSADEAIGKNPRILKSGETSAEEYRKLWATLTSGNIWHGEFHNRRKDGGLFWEAASISPIRNIDGAITHYIAIKEDITERKKLEEQLRQAQKMEAIGQLAGGIAHDFNNILSAIVGYGHLLYTKMGTEDPLRVNVEQILESAERATEVTHSLLAFSKKQLIKPRPVNLNDIIRRFGKLVSRVIGEDIELRTSLADGEITIMADAGQIEQVLMNLATNARDAMPVGGCLTMGTELLDLDETFIRAHGYGKTGTYALLMVADTGTGMAKETAEKIFEPFFTTKEAGKGTGLGLAMVYGIIKQHDGYINVYSETGKGTTFRIYIPAIKKSAEAFITPVDASSLKGGNETVLVAEDDEKLRKLSEIILKEYGYKVILAVDGEDAINRFRDNKDEIRLVMLDMIMPRKTGKEAYEEIRKIRPDVKVLFASGYTADRIDKGRMLEEGFDLIMKPVAPRDLLKKIRELLDKG